MDMADLESLKGENWFPFLYERWRKDTRGLTPAERGIYLHLLIAQIDSPDGYLDGTELELAAAAGVTSIEEFRSAAAVLLKPPYFEQTLHQGFSNMRARWCWRRKNSKRIHARTAAKTRWDKQKTLLLEGASDAGAYAPAYADASCEREEGIGNRENVPSEADASATVPVEPPAEEDDETNWSKQACSDWLERFPGSSAPGGRIGKALKPLRAKHGWLAVRRAWRNYLAQTQPEFVSPQHFANTFGAWAQVRPVPF